MSAVPVPSSEFDHLLKEVEAEPPHREYNLDHAIEHLKQIRYMLETESHRGGATLSPKVVDTIELLFTNQSRIVEQFQIKALAKVVV